MSGHYVAYGTLFIITLFIFSVSHGFDLTQGHVWPSCKAVFLSFEDGPLPQMVKSRLVHIFTCRHQLSLYKNIGLKRFMPYSMLRYIPSRKGIRWSTEIIWKMENAILTYTFMYKYLFTNLSIYYWLLIML